VHIPTPCEESEDSPHGRNEALCQRRGFDLFGLGDEAVAGLRAAPDVTFAVTNTSLGDRTAIANELPTYLRGVLAAPTTLSGRFFEYHFYQAAAKGDWERAKAAVPSLENVRGGGFSFATNSQQYGGPDLYQGHDGSAGVLFAGVQSRAGSCLDQSHSFIANGLSLLAISDCEETWAGGVWNGAKYFPLEAYVEYMNSVGRENFAFDFWKLPDDLADPDRPFLGTSAQTYAVSSDHGRETRARFGTVIPGGRGDPELEGYPLGLDWSWDAATFDVTPVARMQLVQVKIINNSAEVYGTGIDYDSLYVGMQTRWLHAPPGSGRRANVHSIPEMGAVVSNELARNADCDNAAFPSGTFGAGCAALNVRIGRGFGAGATGVVYFKSPIGDLRNKLFTRDPSSPFYDPAHPLAGDTLTFNRMSLCGFDCANVQFVPQDTRKAFGTIAAREADALDGRDPTSLTEYDYWHLFKPARGYNQPRVNLTNPRAGGGFNYCVPGDWTYANRPPSAPAGPDTLFLDDCNPTTNTLTALWSDTLPDRSINWAFNNTWSGAGPFPLAAGDTTGFVFAIITAPDSVQFMQLLKDSYDFYLDFYLGPGTPVPPRIRFAAVDSGIAGIGETRVRLFLDYTAAFEADKSIPNTVNKLRTAAPGTELGRLVALNPWLPDSVAQKAVAIVDTFFIFKSCNGGQTFTATATRGVCPADRAEDATGKTIGTGWQAYATLVRDANGNFPSTFTDAQVTGGQRYLYTLVAHRPALTFTVIDSGVVGGDTTLITREYTVLQAASSALSTNRNAPNVVEIYVPVSAQAGSRSSQVAVTPLGPTPMSYHIAGATVLARIDSAMRYTVFFGDSIKVESRDAITRGRPDSTFIVLYRSARTGFAGGSSTALRRQRDSLVFVADALIPIFGVGAPDTTAVVDTLLPRTPGQPTPTDDVRVTTSLYRDFTAVVAQTDAFDFTGGSFTGQVRAREALYASASLSSGFQPQTAIGLPNAPPLLFNVASRSGFADRFWTEPGFTRLRAVGQPTVGDSVQFTATGAGAGEYTFTWRDSEFGPGAPFTINLTDPSRTDSAVTASLEARVRADSTAVDQATVDVINNSLGTSHTTASFVKLYLPFTVRNLATGGADGRPVTVAALAAQKPASVVLGSGADTVRVSVPADQWVPGTPLILVEDVDVADTTGSGAVVVDANGRIVTHPEKRVTYSRFTIGCQSPRQTCNPVTGTGGTGYVRVRPQQVLHLRFYNPYTAESELAFVIEPPLIGEALTSVRARDLDAVRVVPNPYVVQSSYEQAVGENERRLMFSHVPPQGVINIYTAAGSFVQRITWTPDMLNGTGDLFWDMRTREGYAIGPGLYLFTVQATGSAGDAKRKKPGRFIIIR
jgi:hypothetical protein